MKALCKMESGKVVRVEGNAEEFLRKEGGSFIFWSSRYITVFMA